MRRRAWGAIGARVEYSPLRPRHSPKTAPCIAACPVGTNIRGYLTSIASSLSAGHTSEEALKQAWYILTDKNPLPAVCGRVCPHMCEGECNRREKDGAVNIHAVERAIGDYGVKNRLSHKKIIEEFRPEKVAVIGSGPAGLSCAYQLARRGYQVTIFEAFDKPGGMLRYGIPSYRLPTEILDAEIEAILNLGISINYKTKVGIDIPFEELRKEYQAIYIAIGAHKGVKLGIPGEDGNGTFTGVEFLNEVNSGKKVDIGKKVIVIGGGNTAIDAARVSRRLGADVYIVYRRTRKEMPAIEEEIVSAEEEGVHFEFLAAPVEVLRDGGRVIGIKCLRMRLGEPDASGRPRPIPIKGSDFVIDADTIIAAVRQEPDFTGLMQLRNDKGWITIDEDHQTSLSGVFAGGDVTNELGLVADAIGLGRKAAESIDAYLRGEKREKVAVPPIIRASSMKFDYYKPLPRSKEGRLGVDERVSNFNEVIFTLAEAEAVAEANRCLSCGMCFGCDLCFSYCSEGAVKRAPLGSPFKYVFAIDLCNGCKKCAEACPCGLIEMV